MEMNLDIENQNKVTYVIFILNLPPKKEIVESGRESYLVKFDSKKFDEKFIIDNYTSKIRINYLELKYWFVKELIKKISLPYTEDEIYKSLDVIVKSSSYIAE